SPDSKRFALAGWSKEVLLWETTTRKPSGTLSGFPFAVWSAAFSPDMNRLATANNVRDPIRIWDLESHEQLLSLECQGSLIDMIAFSPDGNLLGVLGSHGVLTIWRAPSWAEVEAAEQAAQK